MDYNKLLQQIKELQTLLSLTNCPDEIDYLEMELMVAEEYLENTLSKGRI